MRPPGKVAGATACRLCRRDVSFCCCNGGRLRRRSVRVLWRHSDGVDRISALHDDLLTKILSGLGSARSAAKTSLVSKRWNKLWTRLPELVFRDIDPGIVKDALRQVLAAQVDSDSLAPPSLLVLSYPWYRRQPFSPAPIASGLHAAARLRPENLVVEIAAVESQGGGEVKLPCLDRAKSLTLFLRGVRLALPSAFGFTKLESLSLGPSAEFFDIGRLLPCFSALRRLELSYWSIESIKINLPLLEELFIRVSVRKLQHIDIVAPRLKKLKFDASLLINSHDLSSWYSAPQVEELSCEWQTCVRDACLGRIWFSCRMVLKTSEPFGLLPHCPGSSNLSLHIENWGLGRTHFGSKFFPVTNISILDLNIKLLQHAYGAIVLQLLGVYSSVRCLKVYLLDGADDYYYCQTCKANCCCRHLNNWQNHNQGISLTALEEVELQGFEGEDHEVDLLEVILTIATNLKAVTVNFSHFSSITDGQCYNTVRTIVEAHPNVKFNIYSSSGQEVLLA